MAEAATTNILLLEALSHKPEKKHIVGNVDYFIMVITDKLLYYDNSILQE